MIEGISNQSTQEKLQKLPQKELELRAHIHDLEQMAESMKLKTFTNGVYDGVDYEKQMQDTKGELRTLEKERRMKDVVGKFSDSVSEIAKDVSIESGPDSYKKLKENISKTMSKAGEQKDINKPQENSSEESLVTELEIGEQKEINESQEKEEPKVTEPESNKREDINESQEKGNSSEEDLIQKDEVVTDTAQVLAEKANIGDLRMKMLETEAEYLNSLRNKYKERNTFKNKHRDDSMLDRAVLGHRAKKIQTEDIRKLQERYNVARSEFAAAVNKKFEARYAKKKDRYEKIGKTENASQYVDKEKLLNRYNRMVVSSDVIKRAMREKVQTKHEALSDKEKNVLTKALGWYTKGNQALEKKIGKVGARGVRILAVATVAGAAGGFLAIGHRVLRSGLGALFGTGASLAAGKLYEATSGRKSKEEYKKTSQETILSVDDIKKQEKALKRGSDEDIASRRRTVEMVTAILVGLGTSLEVSHIIASSDSVNTAVENIPKHVAATAEHTTEPVISGNILDSLKNAPDTAYNTLSSINNGDGLDGVVHSTASATATHVGAAASVAHSVPNIQDNVADKIEYGAANIKDTIDPIKLDSVGGSLDIGDANSNVTDNIEYSQANIQGVGDPIKLDTSSLSNATDNIEYGAANIKDIAGPINSGSFESLNNTTASSDLLNGNLQSAHDVISVVEPKGGGADALFGRLKESLRSAYPDPSTAPPEVRHILNTNLHSLSTEYGFAKPNESALLHTNDVLSYDPGKGELIFTNNNGSHILETTTNGVVSHGQTFDKFDGHYTSDNVDTTSATQNTSADLINKQGVVIENVNPSAPNGVSDAVTAHSSTPVGMPTPLTPNVAEAVSTTAEQATTLHGEVVSLLSPEALGRHANASFYEVLYQSPGIPSQLHEKLIDVVERSGVGPTENETLEHFLNRADSLAANKPMTYVPGVGNLSIPVNETHLYTNTQGDIVVYGGDQSARHLVAYQYLTKHSGANVLFERGGSGPSSGVNSLTLNESPISPANKELLQSFSLVKDASGNVVKQIDPNTLKSVVH